MENDNTNQTDHAKELRISGSTVRIKAYSQQELCELYSVTRKTFHRWIKPFREALGERPGKYFTILQVQTIFEKLGYPGDDN